jgi:hypothetical protein
MQGIATQVMTVQKDIRRRLKANRTNAGKSGVSSVF